MSLAAKGKTGYKYFQGKFHAHEIQQKIGLSNSTSVSVLNVETNETLIFKSNIETAKSLGLGESTLRIYKA